MNLKTLGVRTLPIYWIASRPWLTCLRTYWKVLQNSVCSLKYNSQGKYLMSFLHLALGFLWEMSIHLVQGMADKRHHNKTCLVMSLLERFVYSSWMVWVYAWVIVGCVLTVNPDSLQFHSAQISWVLWSVWQGHGLAAVLSSHCISVSWVEFGVYFFSFRPATCLVWLAGCFLADHHISPAVISRVLQFCWQNPRLVNVKQPGYEVGSVLSIPSVRNGVRLAFLPWFSCRVMPLNAGLCDSACGAAALTSEPARVSADAEVAVHEVTHRLLPALPPFFRLPASCCAAAETSFQLLSKFYFCVCIDTDLLK